MNESLCISEQAFKAALHDFLLKPFPQSSWVHQPTRVSFSHFDPATQVSHFLVNEAQLSFDATDIYPSKALDIANCKGRIVIDGPQVTDNPQQGVISKATFSVKCWAETSLHSGYLGEYIKKLISLMSSENIKMLGQSLGSVEASYTGPQHDPTRSIFFSNVRLTVQLKVCQ